MTTFTYTVQAEVNPDTKLGQIVSAQSPEAQEESIRRVLQHIFDEGNDGPGLFGDGTTVRYSVLPKSDAQAA